MAKHKQNHHQEIGRKKKNKYDFDVDRMVNEGLGAGVTTDENGYIGYTTVDNMKEEEHAQRNKNNESRA